jgi:cephalosporin-C deacetylase-like acetyl esterase
MMKMRRGRFLRWRKCSVTVALAGTISLTLLLHAADVPPANSEIQLAHYLDGIAHSDLQQRAAVIAQIQTRAQAERRKSQVRDTVLRLIGGLPDRRAPLNAISVGTLPEQGFHVERIVYDSLPGFHVTANLYVPEHGKGPWPAVIYTPGHSPAGKLEAWLFAANMARNGIAVLSYDPIGEGERLQYFNPATNASSAGHPTGEHSEASVQTMLTGDHISRYFVWDAMRGIDYLTSRPDIDPRRIGAFGCSGGGTVTAYLAALDDRVKAAGVACFITSFDELLKTIGPQEAEQSIPGFIQKGLGFGDWVEAAAPKPYAVVSTTEDMFPFAGARQSVEEAGRIYALYGAENRLQWITGPGRHGNLRPIYPQIIGFFMRWLEQSDQTPVVEPLPPPPAQSLLCTHTGQVSTSLGGATIFTLNRARAVLPPARRPLTTRSQLLHFQKQLIQQVRTTADITVQPGSAAPEVKIIATEQKAGYRLETVAFPSATGIELTGLLAVPGSAGRKQAVLLLSPQLPSNLTVEGGDLDKLASSGHIVFAPELLPSAKDYEDQKSPLLGPFYLESLRAFLVGKTLVGLRVDDVLRAVDWLASRPDVDATHVNAQASGSMGIVLLHAAALDSRIRGITLDHTLVSYRMAIDQPMPRNLAQSVIPGVLRHYDLDDLILAIAPRPVTIMNPIDAEGNTVNEETFRRDLEWVFASDRNLHETGRVRLLAQPSTGTDAHPEN